jgi:hypothetical protein
MMMKGEELSLVKKQKKKANKKAQSLVNTKVYKA